MTADQYRPLPYPDPTGDIAAARADNYTTTRPRRDGRTFRKVVANGVPASDR